MNPRTTTLILAALVMPLFCGIPLVAQELNVEVANPVKLSRPSETVEIAWKNIAAALPGIAPRHVAVFIGGKRLMSQVLDVNGDSIPDFLIFQSDFAPHQKKAFVLKDVGTEKISPSKTDARFVLPRQDLAWENDRIAFRIYGSVLAGDVNSGIDVWTKRVRSLVVAKWYREAEGSAPGKDPYHEDRGEGADFFSVGKSLGAGSCAITRDGRLYQPGLFTAHRILATGPIRALFEVTYDSGSVDGHAYRVVKRISLDAGQNLNRIEVTFTGFPEDRQLAVAAGLVKRKNVTPHADSAAGWIALWGRTNDDSVNGSLGTGLVLPAGSFRGVVDTEDHLLARGVAAPGAAWTYYAGAGWTRSGDFRSAKEWCAYLARFARKLRAPMRVRLSAPAIPLIPRM